MDPLLRTALVVFAVIAIKAVVVTQWGRFKAKRTIQPIPMRFIDGVYRPWGPVEKIRHYGWRLTQFWLLYMLALLAAVAFKLIGGWEVL